MINDIITIINKYKNGRLQRAKECCLFCSAVLVSTVYSSNDINNIIQYLVVYSSTSAFSTCAYSIYRISYYRTSELLFDCFIL